MNESSLLPIVVVAVTYESDGSALQFVKNVSGVSEGGPVRIVVVDNTARDCSQEFFDKLHNENPSILCVKPPTNLGYFGGANYGLQEYLKGGQGFQWLIVSNIDIEFKDVNFFARLREMEGMEGLGAVAPSIWSKKSLHDQNPKISQRPSKRKMAFYRLIYQNFITINLYGLLASVKHVLRYLLKHQLLSRQKRACNTEPSSGHDGCPNGLKSIYAPQGACFVFSRRFFDCGGSLEYPMFLFYEEFFVAESARRLGLSIVYNPSLRLVHADHVSTGLFRSKKIGSYISKSVNYIVHTYFE